MGGAARFVTEGHAGCVGRGFNLLVDKLPPVSKIKRTTTRDQLSAQARW